jgi:RimJ/RimL family protein N-acetyltransferase
MAESSLTPPHQDLTDGVIRLRLFGAEDAQWVAVACQDSLIPRFTFMDEGLSPEGAAEWIQKSKERWLTGNGRFAIVECDSNRPLGQIGLGVPFIQLTGEVYYWLIPEARGKGMATRAVGLIADWGFDSVGIERLTLLAHPENAKSQRVAIRCGFTREGVLRAYEPIKGTRPDLVSWSLRPSDPRPWNQQPG